MVGSIDHVSVHTFFLCACVSCLSYANGHKKPLARIKSCTSGRGQIHTTCRPTPAGQQYCNLIVPNHQVLPCCVRFVPPLPFPVRHPTLGALTRRARIEHLRISRGVLSVGGRFILTNTPGFTVAHPGLKRGSINFDLAESLSRLVSNVLRLRRE